MELKDNCSRKSDNFCRYLRMIRPRGIPFRTLISGICISLLFTIEIVATGLSGHGLYPLGEIDLVSNRVDIQISGTVTDENGDPLPGASITVMGTTSGTVTDIDGNYTINVPEESSLVFSYIGYESKTVKVGAQTTINVSLSQDEASLDEVVVVGYGTVRKSDLTGSVSSIQADKLNTDSQASVEQIIQGRLPGVQVTQASARPGGNFSIRIRGSNSITAGNEPLYVIDGLPGANPENSLNPSDIKSIEVLKDASATSIYGARGSNGVVLITTKNGKQNSPLTINYNTTISMQEPTRTLDMMDARQYMSFYNDVYIDRGLEPLFSQNDFTTIGAGTDWQAEVFRSAPIQEHRISFSGGSEDTQYFLSLNAFDQDGIVISSGFKRFSGRINLTHSVGDRLRIGINLNNSFVQEDQIPLGLGVNATAGVIAAALQLPPTEPVFNSDGTYSTSLQDLSNPVAQARTMDRFEKRTRLFGNGFLEYELIEDLKAKFNLGIDQSIARGDSFDDVVTQIGLLRQGQASQSLRESNSHVVEFTLDYNKTFNAQHKLNLLGGYSYQEFMNSGFNASAMSFPTTSFGPNNLGSGDPFLNEVGSFKGKNNIVSGFGRVNYAYDERFLMTASFRADGSSRFGANNKFAYFPSGALAWNISNESFFPEEGLVSDIKLRASYGVSGNQEIDNGRSLVLLGSGPVAVFNGNEFQSIAPTQLANPDLKWETTESFNLGVDLGILFGRISGSVEYFQNNTRDLLLLLPIPTTTGFGNSLQNVGNTRNSGFEFSLTSRNIDGNFSWITDINMATVKNEVTNLGELPRILQGGTRFMQDYTILEVGSPVNAYYGHVFDGIIQSSEELANSPSQTNGAVGSRKFRDLNGDNVINDQDRTIIGDPFPNFTLGLNNTLSYKGFSLDVFLEGKFGFEMANFTKIDSENPIDDLRNRQTYVLDRWTPDILTNENPSFVNPSRTYDFNSRIVEDASFVRLRSARIAYAFPNVNIKGISSLLVYASGQNLITWTGYSGYNPDINSLGTSNLRIDYSAYPLARTYALGINIGF
ncbi:TonB-linked outer membrane protein, SusC/RagA family [Cyclobacterium lianum]|uniref:TonB-linked outer membrane protein, SusC/RagA family n=1 Tax=Cyclobacterium lianum TaxID=388280 RepID=A0A1M7QME3_9BACT|nr:TonB-dependent receptor [Cyclobacterium lianum]SHN32621.1 TonB-linked outer membrane protein, SusC/RagA family [Cyclobacterium lianum]